MNSIAQSENDQLPSQITFSRGNPTTDLPCVPTIAENDYDDDEIWDQPVLDVNRSPAALPQEDEAEVPLNVDNLHVPALDCGGGTMISPIRSDDGDTLDEHVEQESSNADREVTTPDDSDPDHSNTEDSDPQGEQPTAPHPTAPQPTAPAHPYYLRSKKQEHYGLHVSVKAAFRQHGKDALHSMYAELEQMEQKKVWRPIQLSEVRQDERIIHTSMFFKEKFLASGAFEKLKARLVAGGNEQQRIQGDDISAPTVNLESVMIVVTIIAHENREVATSDVPGAFLNAKNTRRTVIRLGVILTTVLLIIRPSYKRFVQRDGTLIMLLLKALYGCIESARLWYDHFSKVLHRLGFEPNPKDRCVFNKGHGSDQVTICVHVDDLLISSQRTDEIELVSQQLEKEFPGLKVNRGRVHSYLGMVFDFSQVGTCEISMSNYVEDIIRTCEVSGLAESPATSDLFEEKESTLLEVNRKEKFHSRVAKLLYLAKRVRPDLLTVISYLSTKVNGPTERNWQQLERSLNYLNKTKNMSLTLKKIDTSDGTDIKSFIDSSYAVHPDGKSHSGINISLGSGSIFHKSTKQRIVTKSSTEAELVAASDGLSEVIWTRDFLIAQGYKVPPARIFQDNKSTISLLERGYSNSARTKHINTRYFFIKDRIEGGEIVINYLPTHLMVADILTKPLQGKLLRDQRARLLGEIPSSHCGGVLEDQLCYHRNGEKRETETNKTI